MTLWTCGVHDGPYFKSTNGDWRCRVCFEQTGRDAVRGGRLVASLALALIGTGFLTFGHHAAIGWACLGAAVGMTSGAWYGRREWRNRPDGWRPDEGERHARHGEPAPPPGGNLWAPRTEDD